MGKFDQTGLDAYLDIKAQCIVVAHAWGQLEHHEANTQPHQIQEVCSDPQETYDVSLDDLRDLYALATEHGVGEDKLRYLLTHHLPPAVQNRILGVTA